MAKDNRPRCFLDFTINTARPTGDEYLRCEQFSFDESVSGMFEGHVKLKANDADKANAAKTLVFDKIIGKSATVKIGLPDEKHPFNLPSEWKTPDWKFRCFNGIITRFSMEEPGVYSAQISPVLWKLNLTNRYHLYGDEPGNSATDIMSTVFQVLKLHNVNYIDRIDRTFNEVLKRKQNWLQAGEADYEFIHRLLDKASVYYYFVHDDTSHTMVLSNQAKYPALFETDKKLRYTFTSAGHAEQDDCVTVYSYNQSLATNRVKTTVVRSEAAWEEDSEAIFTAYRGENNKTDEIQDALTFHHYKIFQYSGSDKEAIYDANKTYEKIATAATVLSGQSSCCEFSSGHIFSMTNEPNEDVRPELDNRMFVITSVRHQVNDAGHYENSFEASESTGFLSKFNIQSTHQGSIIAKVCPPPADGASAKKGSWKYLEKQDFKWSKQTIVNPELERDKNYKETGVWVRFSTSGEADPPVWVKLAQHMQTVPEIDVTVTVSRSNDENETPEISSIVQNNGNNVIMPGTWTANTSVGNNYSTSYGDGKHISFGANSKADLQSAINRVEKEYGTGKYKDSSYSQGGSYGYSTSENGRSGLLSRNESHGNTYGKHYGDISENYSDILTSKNESKVGTSTNTSTVGSESNTSKVGTSTSTSTVGTSNSTHTVGVSSSTSTVGSDTSTSTVGSSSSIHTAGSTSSISAVGATSSISATGAASSISATGAASSISVNGVTSNISINGGGLNADLSAAVLSLKLCALDINILSALKMVM